MRCDTPVYLCYRHGNHIAILSSVMAHPNSYPSPTQSQMVEGSHPFYSTQHPAPPPDNIDLNSAPQRHGPTASGSQAQEPEIFGSRDAQASNQFHDVQNSSADQLTQAANQLPAAQDLATPGGKRTKTSRACDQCRSKKVGISYLLILCVSFLFVPHSMARSLDFGHASAVMFRLQTLLMVQY